MERKAVISNMVRQKPEDNLLERKTKGDLKDLPKTLVAFANTVRQGHVATILIGERNDGTPEGLTESEADSIQKRIREHSELIYPPIIWRSTSYENAGKLCIRVEIEPSGDTPHFGAPAWVRRGSVTEKASDTEFQRLIDIRSSMVRELAQWIDEQITLETVTKYFNGTVLVESTEAKLTFVNGFYATLAFNARLWSFPHRQLTISFDNEQRRLKLILERVAVRPL